MYQIFIIFLRIQLKHKSLIENINRFRKEYCFQGVNANNPIGNEHTEVINSVEERFKFLLVQTERTHYHLGQTIQNLGSFWLISFC